MRTSLDGPAESREGLVLWMALAGAAAAGSVAALASPEQVAKVVVLTAVVVVGACIIAFGSFVCLCVLLAMGVSGFSPTLLDLGGASVRLDDLFYLALLLWLPASSSKARHQEVGGRLFKLAAMVTIIFLGYVLVSAVVTSLFGPGESAAQILSAARLAQTASLAWVAFLLVRTGANLRTLANVAAAGAGVAVFSAAAPALQAGSILTARFAGLVSTNTLGLLGGVLVLWGVSVRSRQDLRALTFLTGCAGLLLAKSVGATVGTAVAVVAALWLLHRPVFKRRPGVVLAIVIAIGLLVVSAIGAFRPESLPSAERFRESSAYHRLILGSAGIELFADHPFFGVGWQASASPAVIGAPDLAADLRLRFGNVNRTFYPDVNPTSVHNAYIQMLAELGIFGFLIFLAMLVLIITGSLQLYTDKAGDRNIDGHLTFVIATLFLVIVWWNDNPLFGGQTESILAAVFSGALAGVAAGGTKGRHIPETLA